MGREIEIKFPNYTGMTLDPVATLTRAIERKQSNVQGEYNALVREMRAIRNELNACMELERTLPGRITALSEQLKNKLAALQQFASEASRKGFLIEL